jgi:cytochrome c
MAQLQASISNVGRTATAAAIIVAAVAFGWSSARADSSKNTDVAARVTAILAVNADRAFGEYLAGDCVACHRQSGAADGIPPIAGLPAEHLINALVEYKLGVRANEVMTVRTSRLGDEEIAALAAHFTAQKP